MKLIFENWRKYLSEGEGMKTASDLPDGIVIAIDTDPEFGTGEGEVLFYFAKAETPREFIGWDSGLQGEVRIEPVQLNDKYPCDGAYMVAYSDATKGWGPLLYDVAMEYATLFGGGLVSDRTVVSDEAYAVWKYYLKNRSGPKCTPATVAAYKLKDKDAECVDGSAEISYAQLDNEEGELTKDIKADDCLQNSTFDHVGKTDNEWTKNPLSKLYTKEPTTIDALGDRLVTIGFERWQLGG